MNEQHIATSYAALVARNRDRRQRDAVQTALDRLERSGRDLRNVSLEEFKALLMKTVRKSAARDEHLVGC